MLENLLTSAKDQTQTKACLPRNRVQICVNIYVTMLECSFVIIKYMIFGYFDSKLFCLQIITLHQAIAFGMH